MGIKNYLRTIFGVYKRELLSYFNSPIAYIFIAVFILVSNWFFFNSFFLADQVSLRYFFSLMPWILLFITPAITMRLWAEEKRSGTIETLLTLPITDWQLVGAKFLSAVTFVLVMLIFSLPLPITVSALGNLDWGPVAGGFIGSLFLAGAYLAAGIFISSLTRDQIVAFILGLLVCFAFFIVGADFVLAQAPSFLAPVMSFIGLGSHFDSISRGVIDTRDVIFYISFIFIFLWFNVLVIEKRNWK